MKSQHIRNFVTEAKRNLQPPQHAVNGFSFDLIDSPDHFDPYTEEAAAKAGFPLPENAPRVASFFYPTDDYQAYLNALRESNQEHPANIEKLPWIAKGTYEEIFS